MRGVFPDAFDTARLLLRPVSLADARPIFDGYAQDPGVTRFVTWRPHSGIGQTESHIRASMAAADQRTYALV